MSYNQANILLHERREADFLESRPYSDWREMKLSCYPLSADDLIVTIQNPAKLTAAEIEKITLNCARYNLTFFNINNPKKNMDKDSLKRLGQQIGLIHFDNNLCADEDNISSITVHDKNDLQEGYIPYSTKRLSWHTDGYYNHESQSVRGFILYCNCAAASGGGNQFMDFEILYILLRQQNPDFIRALSAADVLTIPANIVVGKIIRAQQTGPVFSINPLNMRLHMRYSARKKNIIWKQDKTTQAAIKAIESILNTPSPYIINFKLQPGVGVISNNCLHNRAEFINDVQTRLLYRARYLDPISITKKNRG